MEILLFLLLSSALPGNEFFMIRNIVLSHQKQEVLIQ